MNKNLKYGLIIAAVLTVLIAAVVLFLVLRAHSAKPTATGAKTGISVTQFDQLERDMTYDRVVEILGTEGTLQSAVGEKTDPDYLETYVWQDKNSDAAAVVTFHAGLLASKTHTGLTQ